MMYLGVFDIFWDKTHRLCKGSWLIDETGERVWEHIGVSEGKKRISAYEAIEVMLKEAKQKQISELKIAGTDKLVLRHISRDTPPRGIPHQSLINIWELIDELDTVEFEMMSKEEEEDWRQEISHHFMQTWGSNSLSDILRDIGDDTNILDFSDTGEEDGDEEGAFLFDQPNMAVTITGDDLYGFGDVLDFSMSDPDDEGDFFLDEIGEDDEEFLDMAEQDDSEDGGDLTIMNFVNEDEHLYARPLDDAPGGFIDLTSPSDKAQQKRDSSTRKGKRENQFPFILQF